MFMLTRDAIEQLLTDSLCDCFRIFDTVLCCLSGSQLPYAMERECETLYQKKRQGSRR